MRLGEGLCMCICVHVVFRGLIMMESLGCLLHIRFMLIIKAGYHLKYF